MMNKIDPTNVANAVAKFDDPDVTADGSPRASVRLESLYTLWFNTGTLCNIECANCYILSSPKNDALIYLSVDEVAHYLDEIATLGWPTREIGFTGGEPFLNPHMIAMTEQALARGFEVLVLTNAMRPMMRPAMRNGLARLIESYGDKLTLRVSLDHFDPATHDAERGAGSYASTLVGMRWLRDRGARMAVAGRLAWADSEAQARDGFAALFAREKFNIDANDPSACVLFPEMDTSVDVPEITTACWGILNKSPSDVMCASSRMVVKRKGAEAPVVLSCTLLAYDTRFEMGATLAEAARDVPLSHPHCAKFCVLGGASCSG